MNLRLFTDLVLHIKTGIPRRENPSLHLKIFQKPRKTLTRFQPYMYIMHLVILHYCNVTRLNTPLWIYGRTWTLWGFSSMGNTLLKLHQDRIQQWSKHYSWRDNHLVWCLPQGNGVVPPPHERPSFIQKVYSEFGHFRVKRSYSLFAFHYHSRGMYAQVQDVIARCEQCDRVRTSFSSQQLTFFPLPIQGMFYH